MQAALWLQYDPAKAVCLQTYSMLNVDVAVEEIEECV